MQIKTLLFERAVSFSFESLEFSRGDDVGGTQKSSLEFER